MEKSTVFSRSVVGVVMPNSQSMDPFCSNGIRVRDVVGTNSTLTPSFLAKASARSGPNPTGLPPVSTEPIGGQSLRTPASNVPAVPITHRLLISSLIVSSPVEPSVLGPLLSDAGYYREIAGRVGFSD